MKLLFTNVRIGRAPERTTADPSAAGASATAASSASSVDGGNDDSLGRGMDAALTILVFLGIGWLIDHWLGIFPAFTIGLVLFAAVGTFVRMKYTYDARMEQLEADRAGRRRSSVATAEPATAGLPVAGEAPTDAEGVA